MNLANLPKYYQALIAFLGVLATFLTGIQTNEAITGAVPSNWTYGIGLAGSFIASLLVHAKKVEPMVDSTADVDQLIDEIRAVIESYKKAGPTGAVATAVTEVAKAETQKAIQDVAARVPQAAHELTKDATQLASAHVQQVESAVENAVQSVAGNVADEIEKVINTYKAKL